MKKLLLVRGISVFFIVFLLCNTAGAWEDLGSVTEWGTDPYDVEYHPEQAAAFLEFQTLSSSDIYRGIRSSLSHWESAGGISLPVTINIWETDPNRSNDIGVFFVDAYNDDACMGLSANAYATTFEDTDESNITFCAWITLSMSTDKSTNLDFEDTLTHELGHSMDLADLGYNCTSAMCYEGFGIYNRFVTVDDVEGVRYEQGPSAWKIKSTPNNANSYTDLDEQTMGSVGAYDLTVNNSNWSFLSWISPDLPGYIYFNVGINGTWNSPCLLTGYLGDAVTYDGISATWDKTVDGVPYFAVAFSTYDQLPYTLFIKNLGVVCNPYGINEFGALEYLDENNQLQFFRFFRTPGLTIDGVTHRFVAAGPCDRYTGNICLAISQPNVQGNSLWPWVKNILPSNNPQVPEWTDSPVSVSCGTWQRSRTLEGGVFTITLTQRCVVAFNSGDEHKVKYCFGQVSEYGTWYRGNCYEIPANLDASGGSNKVSVYLKPPMGNGMGSLLISYTGMDGARTVNVLQGTGCNLAGQCTNWTKTPHWGATTPTGTTLTSSKLYISGSCDDHTCGR